MGLDERLDERQAEAGAAALHGHGVSGLAERLQRLHQAVLGHADAGVLDAEPHAFAVRQPRREHGHAPARPGELHRVRQQVDENLLHRPLVGQDRGSRVDERFERQPRLGGLGLHHAQRVGRRRGDVDRHGMQFELARLDLRHVEHVVDEAQQVAAAVVDVVDIFAVFEGLERPEGLVPDDVGKPDDRVQRRAQLVAHAGEELGLRHVRLVGQDFRLGEFAFAPALFGDVGHRADGARGLSVRVAQDAALQRHDALRAVVGAPDADFFAAVLVGRGQERSAEGPAEALPVAGIDQFQEKLDARLGGVR